MSSAAIDSGAAVVQPPLNGWVYIKPIGGGADDAPRIKQLLDFYAPLGKGLWLLAGTYTWATSQNLISANGFRLRGDGPGKTIINSTMAALDGHTNTPFYVDGNVTGSNATTTNNGATLAIGATTSVVVNGAAVPSGSEILLIQGANNVIGSYKVTTAGNVITFDRRIRKPFADGATVRLVTFARNIIISDLTIQGTGDRAIQLIAARDCKIQNVQVLSSFSNVTVALDAAPLGGCQIEDVKVTFVANSIYGLAVEFGEDVGVKAARVDGMFTTRNISYNQCNSCWGIGLSGINGVTGIAIETDGTLVLHGQNAISDSDFTNNTLNGALVTDAAEQNTFSACYFGWNFYGLNLGESGVSAVASNRTQANDCQFVGNNTGVIVDDSIGNVLNAPWVEAQAATAIVCQETGSLEIYGLRGTHMVAANFAGIFSLQGTGEIKVIGGSVVIGQANFHDWATITGACKLSVTDHTAIRNGGGTGAFLDIGDAVAARVHVSGCTTATAFATGLTVGTTATCRLSGASVDIGAIPNNGRFNRGTFVTAGVAAVAVAFLDTKATDRMYVTRTVAGAAPGEVIVGAPIVGTGFAPVALAADIGGTMAYDIT